MSILSGRVWFNSRFRRIKLRDLRAWSPGMQFLRALTQSRKVEVSRDSYRYNNSNQ